MNLILHETTKKRGITNKIQESIRGLENNATAVITVPIKLMPGGISPFVTYTRGCTFLILADARISVLLYLVKMGNRDVQNAVHGKVEHRIFCNTNTNTNYLYT